MKKIQAISLALGFILLAYLIYSLGPAEILYSIRLIGVNFTILLLVSGIRQLLRTAAWRECFDTGQSPSLPELFNVRLAGEAIRYLSFTGPFLGEPAKAALIRKNLPLSKGLSSVIVENLTYTLGCGGHHGLRRRRTAGQHHAKPISDSRSRCHKHQFDRRDRC